MTHSGFDPSLTPEERLHALGLMLPSPPKPAAYYLPYKRVGDQLWISGQIAVRGGSLVHEGLVGGDVDLEGAQECARACAINLITQAKEALGELSRVKQIVKISVFVASKGGFSDQHLVANGASELLAQVFGEAGRHARSAVGVASLPLNSPVEIEAVFEVQ
jgi:enamine deaminase RidA (YjgF/YER057c/UK114 family)